MRLDKLLADRGLGTRSEVREMIRRGRVFLNDRTAEKPEEQVEPARDRVRVDGKELSSSRFVYWLLYKPAGFVTAKTDASHRVVMELIPDRRKDLVPVGRLDEDTEGALLFTDDGEMNHRLLKPGNHVVKTYYAELSADLPEDAGEWFREPMVFQDFTAAPAEDFVRLSSRSALLSISEGKYHQVRRMFLKLGCEVTYLRRESFGPLDLRGMKPGDARLLTEKEIEDLEKTAFHGGRTEHV